MPRYFVSKRHKPFYGRNAVSNINHIEYKLICFSFCVWKMATCTLSPIALSHMALLSIQATSPERRFTQKEIIAGEERPKYVLAKQQQEPENATPPALPGIPFEHFPLHSVSILLLWLHILLSFNSKVMFIRIHFIDVISHFWTLDLPLSNDSRTLHQRAKQSTI